MAVARWIPPGLALIATYIVTALALQVIAILASWIVTQVSDAVGLLAFIILFLGSLYIAWPIAIWVFSRSGLEAKLEGLQARRAQSTHALCLPVLAEMFEPVAEPLSVVAAVV